MIQIDKWAGLVTNASPYSIPPGAMAKQENLQCLVPGVLTCRPGLAGVTTASNDTTSSPVTSMARYQHSGAEHIVYQDSQGRIYSSVKAGTA